MSMNLFVLIVQSVIMVFIGIFLGLNYSKLNQDKPHTSSSGENFRVYYREREEAFIEIILLYSMAIIITMVTLFAVLPEGPFLAKLVPQILPILVMFGTKMLIEEKL